MTAWQRGGGEGDVRDACEEAGVAPRQRFAVDATLVVCPTTILQQWLDEVRGCVLRSLSLPLPLALPSLYLTLSRCSPCRGAPFPRHITLCSRSSRG